MWRSKMLLACCIPIVAILCNREEVNKYTLTVQVEDASSRQPVFGPSILVLRIGESAQTTYKNESCCAANVSGGRYHDVPEGNISVYVSKTAYEDLDTTVNVTGDMTVTLLLQPL